MQGQASGSAIAYLGNTSVETGGFSAVVSVVSAVPELVEAFDANDLIGLGLSSLGSLKEQTRRDSEATTPWPARTTYLRARNLSPFGALGHKHGHLSESMPTFSRWATKSCSAASSEILDQG